jgi:hypothetical protein
MTENFPVNDAPAPVDYFGFAKSEQFLLPDGRQYIEFQVMNEGLKAKFQKQTGRDLVIQRNQDARMRMDPAQERHELIKASVTDWNMYRGGTPVPYTKKALSDFLELADPKIIEDLETAIRKANPWLLSDMKSEDIRREIDNLEEMYQAAVEREQGEVSSSSR